MKNIRSHPRNALLAATLVALAAPGLALAGGDKQTNMSAEARDAYREGQIWATYATNPGLDALDLRVDVHGDKATISGVVENPIQKQLAGRIADRTDGIAVVENRITVDPELVVVTVVEPLPSFSSYVADATLEALVDSKLLWNHYTDGMDIDVAAMNGVVTLTGVADTPYSRDLAGRLAATTPGAKLVHNRLTLDPNQKGQVAIANAPDGDSLLSDPWITAKTKSTLLWTEGVQGSDINVDTKQGVVALKGSVGNDYEKELAIDIAQGIRGVRRVDASGLKIDARAEDPLSQR
jgi:osmotically-inducible protein OsmY